jgi:hypothetical protein
VGIAEAAAALRAVEVAPLGTIQDAAGWTDRNGRNVLVVSRESETVTGPDGVNRRTAVLRAVHVARLGTPQATVLRILREPSGAPCAMDFRHDLDAGDRIGADLDGDGYVEVSVAWSSACRDDPGPATATVTLLSNGRKFLVRGLGWPGGRRDVPGRRPDARIQHVTPAAPAWPEAFLTRTSALFRTLYG